MSTRAQTPTAPLSLALVGLGRAGAARERAIEALPGARLCARVRRVPEPGEASLESVLGDDSIDAVVICTPNALHAAAVRRCLEAGKHVAVEYPLALTPEEARALFELARDCGRVLHVEHIELLSASQLLLRERVRALGPLRGGRLQFRGTRQGWIADEALAGPPAVRALARLHRLTDLFGEARVSEARVEGLDVGERLEAVLAFASGGSVTLVEEWAPGLARGTDWEIECEGGRLETPAPAPPGGLFREDTARFLDRITRAAPPYVSDARILHVLELAAEITEAAAGEGSARLPRATGRPQQS